MELVSLGKEVLQNLAEQAASYRLGQSALRYLDRGLWVVEKCARWAVPPPLDQDERPQPELVRPLPWLLFLPLLIFLRFTRESISLINLVMGKPPLRSADVVMYIQSKRRYLRTLKYQGNRLMRARTGSTQPRSEPWYSGLHSLFEFTMCFRRHSLNYGNNNTTSLTNNDEVMVVKRSKRDRRKTSPVASTSEATMERLIEKMMIDLDADSDEDSSYTLTNATSIKSDRSEGTMESDQDIFRNEMNSPTRAKDMSTPTKCNGAEQDITLKNDVEDNSPKTGNGDADIKNGSINYSHIANSTPEKETPEDAALSQQNIPEIPSTIEDTNNFLQHELPQKHRTPKSEKIANGRTVKSAPAKKKGTQERRVADVPIDRHVTANNSL